MEMNLNRRDMLKTSVAFMAAACIPTVAAAAVEEKVAMTGMTTGLPTIDAALGGGLQRGGIYSIFGGPSTGKTSLLQQIEWLNPLSKASGDLKTIELPSIKFGDPVRYFEKLHLRSRWMRSLNLHTHANNQVVCISKERNTDRPHLSGPAIIGYCSSAIFELSDFGYGDRVLKMVKNRYGELPSIRIRFTINGIYEVERLS
jgi:predicted ATP-dependent serine protease